MLQTNRPFDDVDSAVLLMTPTLPFDVRRDACRISAAWRGEWTEDTVTAYATRVRELFAERSDAFDLVVDASGLERCSILPLGLLTDLHAELLPRLRRTVFIATRPQMRGLCLWIVRVSGDSHARVLANELGVDAWLSGTLTREEDARRRMKPKGEGQA